VNADATLFRNLQSVTSKIHATADIDEIILDVSDDICKVFEADRITIYAASEDGQFIVSKVKTGLSSFKDLKLPVAPEFSVAGYVALNRRLVNVRDAYDAKELASIQPPVIFLKEVDARSNYRTRQMLVAPILDPEGHDLLGVVQLINRLNNRPFPKMCEDAVIELCRTLAIAFRHRKHPKPVVRSRFEYLVIDGLLTASQLHMASTVARNRGVGVEEVLTSEYGIRDETIGQALAKYYNVPYEPFRAERVRPTELLKNMKPDFLAAKGWVPLEETEEGVIVLATDPEVVLASRTVPNILGRRRIAYRVCSRREFDLTLKDLFGEGKGLSEIVGPGAAQPGPAEDAEEPGRSEVELANDSTVSNLVNKIILDAFEAKASDIHIEPQPGKRRTRVRFRRDGEMVKYDEIPAEYREAVVARIKIMCDLKIDQKRLPQDGKIKFKRFGPLDIELRVATIPTAGGLEDVVMRILASGKPIPLEGLNLSRRNLATLKGAIAKPYGLFFVCGPTGSGKTTTLHSVLGHLNTEDTKIWTAEDPVEITQEGLRQVQINKNQKLTFDVVMRAFLRADPDVIMVGEMRDKETVSIGVEASLTGHLVLATLHTNSAPESIIRLLDMGMDPFNFADALLGVLAQRLARRLCPDCRQPHAATAEEIKALLAEYAEELKATESWSKRPDALKALYEEWKTEFGDKDGRLVLYSPAGCAKCGNTGYRGRVGLHELLIGTDAIKKDIQDHARVAKLFATALENGMRTLKQDGIEKVLAGLTDMAQVRAVCVK